MTRFLRPRGLRRVVLLAFVACLPACSKKIEGFHVPPVPAGVENAVSGKVIFKGRAVARGYVRFVGESGETFTAVMPGGGYVMPNPPRGLVRIAITSAPPGAVGAAAGADVGTDAFPAKYADPLTSGLTLEVKEGKQTLDIKFDE